MTDNRKNIVKITKQVNALTLIDRSKQCLSNLPISTTHNDIKRTVEAIVHGRPYILQQFKSKSQKVSLLDEAIESNDGNAITTIILFMKQTLSAKLFKLEVTNREEAIDHYIVYLRTTQQMTELIDFLTMLGRVEEAAIVAYTQAIKPSVVESKIKNLKRIRDHHCSTTETRHELKHLRAVIAEQIDLFERQQPIEFQDKKTEETQLDPKSMFIQVPRTTLIGQSVISTLEYCCIYHFDVPETFLASPELLRKTYNLTPKQFTWACLRAIAKCQRWSNVDALFEAKVRIMFFSFIILVLKYFESCIMLTSFLFQTLLGGKRLKPIIPFEQVCKILFKSEAPVDLVLKYLRLIEDGEMKLSLAKEFKYHNFVVELCMNLRDRQTLCQYLPKLRLNSQEYFYAQDILSSPNIKWKN